MKINIDVMLDGIETKPITEKEKKGLEWMVKGFELALLITMSIATYKGAVDEYGSIKGAIEHFSDNYPARMYNPN